MSLTAHHGCHQVYHEPGSRPGLCFHFLSLGRLSHLASRSNLITTPEKWRDWAAGHVREDEERSPRTLGNCKLGIIIIMYT
ncbi:hypothetical protein E2C01_093923 [Portunus trituberculatus]|uniref:Uncharacterized protein n=1 Tax=Portunus trituberculatus TaxID=210409 RepID=A0A5B7JUT0_PORTR|nr:hypothetical protein [Portunus trituberculatus]